uniref:plasmodesmata-located protein 7-like n=1 Tax=Erigeron canadensis TaxID=72917 RepID=UPI001CB91581|nr:plasmodesmata-located protein 7-like [Erigeron canadensis]
MTQLISPLLIIPLIFILSLILPMCAGNSIIYTECSSPYYTPTTPYESNLNTLLTSLVNSASVTTFNKFKISPPGSSQRDVVYGLYQCQSDLSCSDCRDCVASSVSQLRTTCHVSVGGSIQLDGCFVMYNNTFFFGVEDKTEVLKICGPTVGYNSDALNHVDDALTYLVTWNGQYFRKGGFGSVQGVAQCIQDLSASQCEDCLIYARGRLRSQCETSSSGDMYLGKCYLQYKDLEVHPIIGKR